MTATDPGRTAYEALAQRLRAWGENDADPVYFQGDVLSCVLLDCGAASEAIAQLLVERDSAEKEMEMAAMSGGFYARHAENATKRAEAAEHEAYELKLAAAGGEDVPGSANCVTAADVTRWREEGVKLERAQDARFTRLLIAFHDAIRRPLGVTPDSGAEFYDPRMADEAEDRRRLKQVGGRHQYQPHKRYPHFCACCGYPEREVLKHFPAEGAGLKERGGGSAA